MTKFSVRLLCSLCACVLFAEVSKADTYSAYIGPQKNYLCRVSDSGAVLLYKKTANVLKKLTLSREITSTNQRETQTQNSINNALKHHSSRSSTVTNLKKQLSQLKSLVSALKKCASRAKVTEAPCAVIRGSSAASTRIANGTHCSAATSPVVFVQLYYPNGEDAGFCSGTVVGPHTVLSAGHCFEDGVRNATITVAGQDIISNQVIVHPNYTTDDATFQFHDMSLIKFNNTLPVTPMGILTTNAFTKGESTVIAGYGDDEFGGTASLRAATALINRTSNQGIEIKFTSTGNTGNTCEGDSGGPILVNRNGKWLVAGATSNGDADKCGVDDTSRFSNIAWDENLSFLLANLS